MGLFGKKSAPEPQLFSLPSSLRSDIRKVFEAAPADACNGLLQEAKILPVLLTLNEGLPADETVSALTRCVETWKGGGYMVLTDRRLIFALKPVKGEQMNDGPPEMIAIQLGHISQFVFDSGVAAAAYGNEHITVGLVHGGPHSQEVCSQVKAAVVRNGPHRL